MFDFVISLINTALHDLWRYDNGLFANNAREETLTGRLHGYLMRTEHYPELKGLSWDVEYDRDPNISHQKKLGDDSIRVDLVLHERCTNKKNICAIEVKRIAKVEQKHLVGNDNTIGDFQKVLSLTSPSLYQYERGISLILGRHIALALCFYAEKPCIITFKRIGSSFTIEDPLRLDDNHNASRIQEYTRRISDLPDHTPLEQMTKILEIKGWMKSFCERLSSV